MRTELVLNLADICIDWVGEENSQQPRAGSQCGEKIQREVNLPKVKSVKDEVLGPGSFLILNPELKSYESFLCEVWIEMVVGKGEGGWIRHTVCRMFYVVRSPQLGRKTLQPSGSPPCSSSSLAKDL